MNSNSNSDNNISFFLNEPEDVSNNMDDDKIYDIINMMNEFTEQEFKELEKKELAKIE